MAKLNLNKSAYTVFEWLCKEMLEDQNRAVTYTEDRERRLIEYVLSNCKDEPQEEVERIVEFIRTKLWSELERLWYEQIRDIMYLYYNADEATRKAALEYLRNLKKNTAPGVGSTEDGKSGKVDSLSAPIVSKT